MNKALVVVAVVLLSIVALVFVILLATGAVRLGGSEVEEVFCSDPDEVIVLCEDQ